MGIEILLEVNVVWKWYENTTRNLFGGESMDDQENGDENAESMETVMETDIEKKMEIGMHMDMKTKPDKDLVIARQIQMDVEMKMFILNTTADL